VEVRLGARLGVVVIVLVGKGMGRSSVGVELRIHGGVNMGVDTGTAVAPAQSLIDKTSSATLIIR
jgi:hypothetical protein